MTLCLCLCKGSVKLDVNVTPATGQFEISDNEALVASGRVSILAEPQIYVDADPTPIHDTGTLPLNSDDIYKDLRLRGHEYGPTFRGILSADATGECY